MVFFMTTIPIIGILGTSIYVFFNGIKIYEPILLISLWFISGIGITMGYHRLFSHKSYKTNIILEWIMMIFGSIALENTILKWSSDHRKHHSHAETEHDPYSITKGFWHAHIGWIIKNTDEEKNKIIGVKDLEKKSAIIFQNKYYLHIAILFGFILPLIIGIYFDRPLGAILWGTFLRITLVHHATFLINSLCHYKGSRTYDAKSTSRDSWIMSLFTFGEGYHNYHHKFPSDFRNGISWFAFDPSKWIINTLSLFNITNNLIKTKDYIILRSKIESIYERSIKKLKNSTIDSKNNYNKKINNLFDQANKVLLKWQELEKNAKDFSNKKYKILIKEHKISSKKIFKELIKISKEINNNKIILNSN